MTFFFIAFAAGALTVLAPCILPLLPVVVGSAAAGRSRYTPYVVVGSLALSVIAFTYLLKATTAFIAIPPEVWTYLSGGILVLFGVTLFFPGLWERIPGMAKLSSASNKAVGSGYQKKNLWGDALVGAALGPVFSTCSPTYFVILASVLPASFLLGTVYLLAYVLGLSLVLLAFALLGERLVGRLESLANPKGWFKRTLGALFIVLGLLIVFGIEKKIETAIIESGFFDVTQIEQRLLQSNEDSNSSGLQPEQTDTEATQGDISGTDTTATPASFLTFVEKSAKYPKAPELVTPDAYLNTNGEPITIAQFKGKKVVLIDFWTYSCINCQRTLPYLKTWYETYEKDGLVIIGIHTPEFAFEKVKANVEEALASEGITYPVVLDNQYQTWGAYKNQYWPRKYLIDIDGYVVYDHIGEGAYKETEDAIRTALKERAQRLAVDASLGSVTTNDSDGPGITGSPETYFGALRNEYLANGKQGETGVLTYELPAEGITNRLYLGGTWDMRSEYAEAKEDAVAKYRYFAKEVYLVASAEDAGKIQVWQDGKLVSSEAGLDVVSGSAQVGTSRLYRLIKNATLGDHVLELRASPGVRFYAFTFG